MINVEINSNGFASGESWDKITYDPNLVDTYTIKTTYPEKYKDVEKYYVTYQFRNRDELSERIDLSTDDTVVIPTSFLASHSKIICIFIATILPENIDVMTSTFELVMTLQSSSYLNPDANEFIVVPTVEVLNKFSSDYLADGKVVKVAYDSNNNQQPSYYTWDALQKKFVYDSTLNRKSFIINDKNSLTVIPGVTVGSFAFINTTSELYVLTASPSSEISNWHKINNLLDLEEVSSFTEGDFLTVVNPDGTQSILTVKNFVDGIGNWQPIE